METTMSDTPQDIDYDEPEPCPMGCGRTTEDVAGGPCYACWDLAPTADH